jgi:hypothetical protein
MSKLLDQTVATVRSLPTTTQDEIARAMLSLAGDDAEPELVDASYLPAVLEGLAQARRGERATPQQVEAAFRRFDA